jgi:hypothetical protein
MVTNMPPSPLNFAARRTHRDGGSDRPSWHRLDPRRVCVAIDRASDWVDGGAGPYCVGTLAAIWLAMLTAESVGLALHVLMSITTLFFIASARPQAQPGALAFC